MKHIWCIVNIGLVTDALWDGYKWMAPEKLHHTNPDPILCVVILLVMPLFALWSVHYSIRRWKHNSLARPSWDRNPLNWWHDPLQSLFVSTFYGGSHAVGSALRHPAIGSVGFWTFGLFCCMTIGLLIGRVLVYRTYRKHIMMSNS